jgi:hypothetical protein
VSRLAFRPPAAALLALAMLWLVLAASIRSEKLTRIEPVNGLRAAENGRQVAMELRIPGTPMTPKSASCRWLTEAKNFLHATVAVRGDHQDRARQPVPRINSENQIMMKLALLPVVDDLVATVPTSHVVEERTQSEVSRKLSHGHHS